jgi:hypothetical protein
MPISNSSKRSYIPLFFLLIFVVFFSLFKVVPLLGNQVKGAEGDPLLVDFKLEKTVINTDLDADTLTVYARASTPEPEGHIDVQVSLGANLFWEIDEVYGNEYMNTIQSQSQYLELMTEGCDALTGINIDGLGGTCGDYTDGIFAGTFSFPRYSAIGDGWLISAVTVSDGIGDTPLQGLVSFDDKVVTTESGEKNIAFSNEGLIEDTTAPVIEDYVLVPSSIDTSNAPQSITMYARVSEDLSEVTLFEDSFEIIFTADDDPGFPMPESKNFSFSLMTEGCDSLPEDLDVSGLTGCGDATDGIYSATAEVPRYSLAGTWSVSGVWNLQDTVGNATDTCTATFENTATVYDDEAPKIQGITITPTEFDTRDSAQTITFEIEITDDISGVASISIGLRPVVNPMETVWLDTYTITDGDELDGTFMLETEIPQGAPQGFWAVNNIDVTDTLGRADRYSTSELSLAFPNLSLYLLNQGTTEEVTLSGDWALEDWPYYDGETVVWPDISVRFEEGTVITKEEGGVFAFHRMLATKYDYSIGTGVDRMLEGVNSDYQADLLECDPAEGCTSTAVDNTDLVGTPLHIIKMGIPGLNLTFSKPVTIIVGMDEEYLGTTFIVQTFDEDLNKWVEHGNCTVAMVEPPSTEHGGDGFGEVRPIAYPGCSFTTTHASFFSTNVLGLETEEGAGVPETGLGGIENSILANYFKWLR